MKIYLIVYFTDCLHVLHRSRVMYLVFIKIYLFQFFLSIEKSCHEDSYLTQQNKICPMVSKSSKIINRLQLPLRLFEYQILPQILQSLILRIIMCIFQSYLKIFCFVISFHKKNKKNKNQKKHSIVLWNSKDQIYQGPLAKR